MICNKFKDYDPAHHLVQEWLRRYSGKEEANVEIEVLLLGQLFHGMHNAAERDSYLRQAIAKSKQLDDAVAFQAQLVEYYYEVDEYDEATRRMERFVTEFGQSDNAKHRVLVRNCYSWAGTCDLTRARARNRSDFIVRLWNLRLISKTTRSYPACF